MPNFKNWGNANRAADAWERISERPTSILIVRGGVNQPAQTVRLEMDNTASEITGDGGTIISVRRGTIFGVKGHPSPSVPDTVLKKGDQFAINKVQHVVVSVIEQKGEIQAICQVTA